MNQKNFLSIILVFSLMLATFSNAEKNSIKKNHDKFELVGQSVFSVLFWDIYKISLYSLHGEYSPGQVPLTLELTYMRAISSQDLIEETEKQWSRFELDETNKDVWLEQLALIWPDVKKSDTIKFHVSNKYDTTFYLNNVFIGKVEGQKFAHAFTMIWLDTNGPYPKMTRQLIGKRKIK
jgi:hypothetical protein